MSTPRKVFSLSILVVAALVALLLWRPEGGPDSGPARRLLVYCAAGLRPPVEATARAYEKTYGAEVQIQYGGSGTLLSSIQVARLGDLYLPADDTYVDMARSKDLIREVIPIASQIPVVAVRKGNPKDVRALADLLRDGVRVALANPDAASVGRETREALSESGGWAALEAHVRNGGVFKPTVTDVANDVKLGTVDAGIVWDVTVRQYPELEAVHLPVFEARRSRISVCVLSSCRLPAKALHFARYLTATDRGLPTFQMLGYATEGGDAWAERPEIVLYSGGVNRVAIEETLKEFQAREGATVITNYNGCGVLVGEMKTGKRPDAYFACDVSYMKEVEPLFGDEVPVSETDMVLLVAKGNPRGIHTLQDLAKPGTKVAVANASYSALGGLTDRLLADVGLLEEVRKNITFYSPTADLLTVRVKTGREDVAILYRANTVNVRDETDVVPLDLPQAKAIQPIAVCRDSRYPRLTERLVDAIRSAASRRRFEASGFRWLAGPGKQVER